MQLKEGTLTSSNFFPPRGRASEKGVGEIPSKRATWHRAPAEIFLAQQIQCSYATGSLIAAVAPDDRVGTFVWLTLFFGRLGILAAAVASPRDPDYFAPGRRSIAKGSTRYQSSRCGAESDPSRH